MTAIVRLWLSMWINSGIRQGDPPPLLFKVVTIFLIYDLGRLHIEVRVFFYAYDILICLLGCRREHSEDKQALPSVLNLFRYFSGLRVNYKKTFAIIKTREECPQPGTVVGTVVKPWVKHLGVLLGNVSAEQAYGPAVAKMLVLELQPIA